MTRSTAISSKVQFLHFGGSQSASSALWLLIIPDADEVAGNAEGRPRDVEPAAAGE